MKYKPIKLSAEAFNELRVIVEEEIEGSMMEAEIEEMGINILRLFDTLLSKKVIQSSVIRPNEQELKALAFLQIAVQKGKSPSIRDLSLAMGFRSSRSGFRLLHILIGKGWAIRENSGLLRLSELAQSSP
jgi:hypothetical protein